MITNFKKNTGFTLIEVIISIAIIGIISSTTVVTFNRFSSRQNLNIAYDDVKNALSEAKSNSASQVIISCTENLLGYEVVFNAVNKTYSINEACSQPLADPVVKTYKLPSGINFNNNVSPPSIMFNTLTGGSNGGSVTLTNGTASQNKSIMVESTGIIK